MKHLRKLMALVLVAMVSLAVSTTAWAAGGTPSITINPNNVEEDTSSLAIKYTYYKIMSASIDTDATVGDDGATTTAGKAAYYVENQAQATAIEGTGLFNVTQVTGSNKWYVELKSNSTTADQIIAKFKDPAFLANFTKQEYTKAAGTASAVLPDVSAGYYYIESSLGTKAAVQTLSPVTINEKNSYPGIGKTQANIDAIAGIGDTLTYTITVNIPESVAEKEIKVVDTITNGLTLNTTATVKGAVESPAYTSATFVQTNTIAAVADDPETPDVDETKKAATEYTITIPAATVIANKGKTLTFTYHATVNTNAVVLEPENNTAHLEYDNYKTVETPTVSTKTLAFDIQKVDGTDKTTVLAGAEFKLYKTVAGSEVEVPVVLKTAASNANGNVNVYRVAVEGETGVAIVAGTARIEGLNDEEYKLEETKAPTGYNLLTEKKSLTASETTSTTEIDLKIENNKGATLPSTGGIGTTIFYTVGGLMLIGGAVMLVTKKRMAKVEG